MSDRVDSGQPLNILNVDGRSLELDEHGLARLLLDERVKDKPVVVIAVAGAFRKGKSFLLCFLIRYLRSEGRAEWLGDPNAPLEGFGWRGGSERHTTGILMWNEVFLVKTSQGNELAVLLMDTQGTFDCESASVVHASIFALSAMISSVLVYNVSQNIQQNDLQHLKDFIEYGMMTMSEQQQQQQPTTAEVGSTRPFQSLMFLVRDWQFEMPYGLAGGQQLLEKRLKGPPNQDRELRQLRRKLSKCFRKMHCFLMPHPGLTVAQEGFDGRLSDIGETFKLHLSEFVRLLLEPDNLQPKKINGREITCLELLSYIKVYVGATKRGLLDDPSQMLEATHAGSCRAAMDKSLDFYTTSMLSLWQNSPDDDADRETMRRYHNELRKVAVEQYSAAPKMGGELPAQLYLHKLKEKMDVTFDVYCEYLKEKKKTFVNAAVFKHVAFKVAHGFLTTGLAAAAIALAVVELPVVAIALGAFGAASLSGHLVQVIVEMELAKRKRKERHENSKAAAEAAKRRGFGGADIEEFDDEVPLFAAEDDTGSVLSLELAESAATSPEPPVTVTDGAETTRGNRSSTAAGASNGRDGSDDCIPLLHASDDTDSVQSADFPDFERVSLGPSVMVCDDTAATEATNAMAFARAIKHYSDGMQQVCGDSIPRLSEEDLQKYHDLLQVYAHEILMRGCSSAGKRVLPHFVDRLTNEIEEQLKNFVNQNREKTTVMT
ncbi:atlastin-1 isoform X3 [Rhipicephalus sanguineus]|nr:atlastin-1 isoform X3 [Rhipicephalus sanguineus]